MPREDRLEPKKGSKVTEGLTGWADILHAKKDQKEKKRHKQVFGVGWKKQIQRHIGRDYIYI